MSKITKEVEVTINIDVARRMLKVAGFTTSDKSDNEIFEMVLERMLKYGATTKTKYTTKINKQEE